MIRDNNAEGVGIPTYDSLTESLLTVFCSISGAAIVCKISLLKRHKPDKMLHSIKSGWQSSSASVRRKFKHRQIENILSISLSDKPKKWFLKKWDRRRIKVSQVTSRSVLLYIRNYAKVGHLNVGPAYINKVTQTYQYF